MMMFVVADPYLGRFVSAASVTGLIGSKKYVYQSTTPTELSRDTVVSYTTPSVGSLTITLTASPVRFKSPTESIGEFALIATQITSVFVV